VDNVAAVADGGIYRYRPDVQIAGTDGKTRRVFETERLPDRDGIVFEKRNIVS
jgi:hypothetical protein